VKTTEFINAIEALEREIAGWERSIQESQHVIARIDRDVSAQQGVIDLGNQRIAELRSAIDLLRSAN
jgi:prefoldin subunit 5